MDAGRGETVRIDVDRAAIGGDLTWPGEALGLVIFAHGSGSSRFSSRNRAVATALQRAGFATLLIDLLTEAEEAEDRYGAGYRFDVGLLARRVAGVTGWCRARPDLGTLPIAYFGASTGAAAALIAAASRPGDVAAIVSRGGRPDLAGEALARVTSPTLLIVGGADPTVLELNRQAMQQMRAPVTLEIVPRATHLFEEPGALEAVARLVITWLRDQLGPGTARPRAGA